GAAVEDVDAVLAVDGDGCDVGEGPSIRQLCPVFDDAIAVFAGSENWLHRMSPLDVISGRCASIEPGISRFRVWSFGPSRNDRLIVSRHRRLVRRWRNNPRQQPFLDRLDLQRELFGTDPALGEAAGDEPE